MRLPKLMELQTSREMVDVFKGYNHNLRIGSGEFYDMKNLSSDNYPLLSPRQKRSVVIPSGEDKKPKGIIAKKELWYVDGTKICQHAGEKYDLGLNDEDKQLVSMGAYIIIMPDKKYINTENTDDRGDIEETFTSVGEVSITPCKVDGVAYENIKKQDTEPTDKTVLWLDTSSEPHSLKQYSTSSSMWVAIPTTYVKIEASDIEASGIGAKFNVYDGVTISGINDESLSDLNASAVIWAKGDGYIVVTGLIDKAKTITDTIKVERRMPDMDFITESENRIFGCKYGKTENGEMINEIYASKLGDFKNWNCFMGISTDSYAASVGSDGPFTGAITHLGYPLFFKENCLHKIYGNYPANYQIQTTSCRGVQRGCDRSLAIVNEVLYYKARSGVCAYDGSLPVEMSYAFGSEESYSNAVAGALGNKYYVSMINDEGEWTLFVYDTSKGMWHKEDALQVSDFCNFKGNLYLINYATNDIMAVHGSKVGVIDELPVKWEAITGVLGTDSPDKKYISRIDVRMTLEVGARVIFFAEYDSSGVWEHLFTMTGRTLQSFSVPIRPQRCDHLRLKIEGEGDAKVFSICKTVEEGSDV